MRLTLNLVDAQQLHQLSSRTLVLTTGPDQITPDTVVETLASLLDLQLNSEARRAITAGGTTALGAYDSMFRDEATCSDRPENIDLAIERFTRAIALDDRYALAHAGSARRCWRSTRRTRMRPGSSGPWTAADRR